MLSAAALYNGFPLVDYDSGTHIASAASGRIFWMRSPIYSYFVLLLDGGGRSLWPVVIAQGLIGAYLIHLVLRVALGRSSAGWYLGIVLALTGLTSLPWLSGQIMPDLFAGYVILATFLLGCGTARLSRFEIALIFAIDAFLVAAHFSHVMLAAALGLAVVLVLAATRRRVRDWLPPLARLAAPVIAAVAAMVLHQGAITGQWGFATGGRVYTLERWVAGGPALAFLREACPARHFVLCDYLDELPTISSDDFFWGPRSIVARLGGPMAAAPEARAVVLGTLMRHPLWVAEVVAASGWSQLWRFDTGTMLVPLPEANPKGWAARAIKEHVAPAYPAYVAARQVADALHLAPVRAVDRIVAWACLAAFLPLIVVFWRRQDWWMVSLLLIVGLGLVINAFACAANAVSVDRYQARVIWLAAFAVFTGLARLATAPEPRFRA